MAPSAPLRSSWHFSLSFLGLRNFIDTKPSLNDSKSYFPLRHIFLSSLTDFLNVSGSLCILWSDCRSHDVLDVFVSLCSKCLQSNNLNSRKHFLKLESLRGNLRLCRVAAASFLLGISSSASVPRDVCTQFSGFSAQHFCTFSFCRRLPFRPRRVSGFLPFGVNK